MKLLLEGWDRFLNEAKLQLADQMAAIIMGEAVGEGPEGMYMVYHTILNRARRIGESPLQIATEEKQYSILNNNTIEALYNKYKDHPYWPKAVAIVQNPGTDPTRGATHYYNPKIVKPSFAKSPPDADPNPCWVEMFTYGNHVFGQDRSSRYFGEKKDGRCYVDKPETHPRKGRGVSSNRMFETIEKRGSQYCVLSKSKTKDGKRKKLGCYPSKEAAKKRLQQVEYFKHMKENNLEEKKDRCYNIAKRKYDTFPSAYASGAIVKCRQGKIWKDLKEEGIGDVLKLRSGGGVQNKIDLVNALYDESRQLQDVDDLNEINVVLLMNLRELMSITDRPEGLEVPEEHIKMLEKKYGKIAAAVQAQISKIGNVRHLKEDKKTDFSKEKESGLHGWFSRQGGKGKSKGWVDCNTCREDKKTGRKTCKSCGRKEGEKRDYPACRPTPSACGTKGKGKSWGKKSSKKLDEAAKDYVYGVKNPARVGNKYTIKVVKNENK